MSPALRALLSGLIDYAGLFPPAGLPMEQAIRNYARYRAEPEAWMLGRFVCPAAKLGELSSFMDELFAKGPPLTISAVESKFKSYAEYLEAQRTDEQAIRTFLRRHPDRAVISAREQRYPGPFDDKEIRSSVPTYAAAPTTSEVRTLSRIYYEIDAAANWRKKVVEFLSPFAEILRLSRETAPPNEYASAMAASAVPLGFKIRCGGPQAADFPPPEDVAFAIVTCRNIGVPFKATAGLHHPIRKYHTDVKTKMHGFLNVFGAGVLACAARLTEAQILEIVRDEDPKNFLFDDAGFCWKNHRATSAQVTAARQVFTSFGSCSFDEPRADLKAMRLL